MASRIRWTGDRNGRDSSSSAPRGSDSDRSSAKTYSTAPTDYSPRPRLPRYDTCDGRVEGCYSYNYDAPHYDHYDHDDHYDNGRSSVETYASTIPSEDDFSDDDSDAYEMPEWTDELYYSDAIPSTPKDFADFFPSQRRMSIRHDDATMDGNMNLRVDTDVETRSGRKRPLTLFHLRMHDLKSRDFSLRRYCRESGREVCHCVRKYQKPASERRPALQKSFTTALAPFRKNDSKATEGSSLRRHDSGYGSLYEVCDDVRSKSSAQSKKSSRIPTNTIKLEFSNYAHVDVKRRGTGSHKRYEFEYWGVNYAWKRHVRREGRFEEVSFHLVRDDKNAPLAHIVPVPLTTVQAREERLKGGWVPPCSMWISDNDLVTGLPDVADVIIASGLIALVDDAIKRRWHSKHGRQLLLPIARSSSFRMDLEYVGPKRLIDEVFNRGGSAHMQRPHLPRRVSVEA